ncbi:MAG: hypothetical protein H7833_07420 [Magnetococcus sp. DMHC-1]
MVLHPPAFGHTHFITLDLGQVLWNCPPGIRSHHFITGVLVRFTGRGK